MPLHPRFNGHLLVDPEPNLQRAARESGWRAARVHTGRGPSVRWARPTHSHGLITKGDFLTDEERSSYERTPFSGGQCSQCEQPITNELEFADHYYVPDTTYLNLGNCPYRGRS